MLLLHGLRDLSENKKDRVKKKNRANLYGGPSQMERFKANWFLIEAKVNFT